jgi:propanol-preferring alcohol dehydrogenase
MVLRRPGESLVLENRSRPTPGPGQVLVRVNACGVCRTDLHVVDGELTEPRLPIVPGHEVVGTVAQLGGRENLCDAARFTGYQLDGGYADYLIADQRYCFPLADGMSDAEAAPLLCAGLIGYRSLRMAGDARRLGIYGFGAAAHIVAQVAVHEGRTVFAFTRTGDRAAQDFARGLGAAWAGASEDVPPEPLDAAIIFAPVGALVPAALRAVTKGGTVVCAGIHMSDIPSFPYDILWGERTVRSVANLTRRDGEEFLALAPTIPVRTEVSCYPLENANQALSDLRDGRLQGAAVLLTGE